jgi:hypothetical protein
MSGGFEPAIEVPILWSVHSRLCNPVLSHRIQTVVEFEYFSNGVRVLCVVVTDLLDQQDKLVRRLLLVVEFKFCMGRGCSIDQLTER